MKILKYFISATLVIFCSCLSKSGGHDPGVFPTSGGSSVSIEDNPSSGHELAWGRNWGNSEGYDGIDDIPCEDNSCYFWITPNYSCDVPDESTGSLSSISSFRGALKIHRRRIGDPRLEWFQDACVPFNEFASSLTSPVLSSYNPDFVGFHDKIYERRHEGYIAQIRRDYLDAVGRPSTEPDPAPLDVYYTEAWCRNELANETTGIDIMLQHFPSRNQYRAYIIDARNRLSVTRYEWTDLILVREEGPRIYQSDGIRLRISNDRINWHHGGSLQLGDTHLRMLCRLQLSDTVYSKDQFENRRIYDANRIWVNRSISVSLVPDGTPNGFGGQSRLFELLNSHRSYSGWQLMFARALQKWADVAPLSFYFRTDDGSEMGAMGEPQGDSRFGDIRVGTASLRRDRSAFAFFPPMPGFKVSEFGDLYIEENWITRNPDASSFYASLVHEIGHALGLPHSDDPDAIMHPEPRNSGRLGVTDIRAIQVAYGSIRYDEYYPNENIDQATALRWYGDSRIRYASELGRIEDIDCYQLTIPRHRSIQFQVSSKEKSLLVPKVRILDSIGKLILQLEATQPPYEGPSVAMDLASSPSLRTVYLCVEKATSEFGIGKYNLIAQLK